MHIHWFELTGKDECAKWLSNAVKERLKDPTPTLKLREIIQGLESTGFAHSAIQEEEKQVKVKDWEIGEAVAEVFLMENHECHFPWPTRWDRRTPEASLPGPDLVGFHSYTLNHRFVFGEVKTSSELVYPPTVIRDSKKGLKTQLKNLLESEDIREQLVQWLYVRAPSLPNPSVYDEALKTYYLKGTKAWILGMLVRGSTKLNAKDMESVKNELEKMTGDFEVTLMVIHLPYPADELLTVLNNGVDKEWQMT